MEPKPKVDKEEIETKEEIKEELHFVLEVQDSIMDSNTSIGEK